MKILMADVYQRETLKKNEAPRTVHNKYAYVLHWDDTLLECHQALRTIIDKYRPHIVDDKTTIDSQGVHYFGYAKNGHTCFQIDISEATVID